MEEDFFKSEEKLPKEDSILDRYGVKLIFGFAVAIFAFSIFLAVKFSERQLTNASPKIALVENTSKPKPQSATQSQQDIVVEVAGAVNKPGVYTIAGTSRVSDAITVAGGFATESANKDFIARQLNLAAKLSDGQKVYVTHKGEDVASVPQAVLGASTTSGSNRVNINTAQSIELEKLSGIGTVTAKKIIDNRPYSSTNDLITKKVLSQSVYNKVQQNIIAP